MINKYLSFAAIALVLGLASCSSDTMTLDNITIDGQTSVPGPGEGRVNIGLAQTGKTRSARPVYSSEAYSNVDKVQLKLYKKGTDSKWSDVTSSIRIIATYTGSANITGDPFQEVELENGLLTWDDTAKYGYTPGTANMTDDTKWQENLVIKRLDKNAEYYMFAYGYNSSIDIVTNHDAQGFPSFTVTGAANISETEEVFYDAVPFTTDGNGNIVVNGVGGDIALYLELERQVAGVMGYFKNIPKNFNDGLKDYTICEIRVYIAKSSPKFDLVVADRVTGSVQNNCLQNGIETISSKTLLFSIPLNTSLGTQTTEGYTHCYYIPGQKADIENGIPAIKTNAVLGGAFVIPFTKSSTDATLIVALAGKDAEDNVKELKYWNVKNTSNELKYDINRNYFYSIGHKGHAYTTNGKNPDPEDPDDDDPNNPDPDPSNPDYDDPLDLSKIESMTVVINDSWSVVEVMTLE